MCSELYYRAPEFGHKKTHTDLRTRKICMGKVTGHILTTLRRRCLAPAKVSARIQRS